MYLNVRGKNGITEFLSRYSPSMSGLEWQMLRLTVGQTVPLRHREADYLLKYIIFDIYFFTILQMIFRTHANLRRRYYCPGRYSTLNSDEILCNNVFQSWENILYSFQISLKKVVQNPGNFSSHRVKNFNENYPPS